MARGHGILAAGRCPSGDSFLRAAITMDPMHGSHIADSRHTRRFPAQTRHSSLPWSPYVQPCSLVSKIDSEDNVVKTMQSHKHRL